MNRGSCLPPVLQQQLGGWCSSQLSACPVWAAAVVQPAVRPHTRRGGGATRHCTSLGGRPQGAARGGPLLATGAAGTPSSTPLQTSAGVQMSGHAPASSHICCT
jgi:hypothetical protein